MITDVRTPTLRDVAAFQFRALDAEECVRGGSYPTEALAQSVQESTQSYLLHFDDEPAVMWGYRTYELCPSVANVWMLTSPAVDNHKWEFVREIRKAMRVLDSAFVSYHILVLRDYTAARRLFAILGFVEKEISNPEFILMEKKGRPIWVN